MGRKPLPSDLTDAEYRAVAATPEKPVGSDREVDLREVLNGLITRGRQWD